MSDEKLLTKEEMKPGAIAEAGSMKKLNTGSWRSQVPLTELDDCIHCMLCWIYCPDSAIVVKDGKKLGTDMQYCKGCGICAKVCPVDCIEMKLVGEATDEEVEAEHQSINDIEK